MPGTCGICGEQCVERTNNDGGYKGACADCRNTDLGIDRHFDTCEDPDCLVCIDYLEEFGP